jgi:GTPase
MESKYILPPEIEVGNVEYKRHLYEMPPYRIIKLASQLLYRMNQGYDKDKIFHAIYYIGIEDDGQISGESIQDLKKSLKCLTNIVNCSNAEVDNTEIFQTQFGSYAKVKIIKNSKNDIKPEYRIGFIGPTNSGKSTIIGVLSHGFLDNGNGSARSTVLRYNHEKKNGTTSSIKQETIGYNSGTVIQSCGQFIGVASNMIAKSDRFVTLIDFPGSTNYMKTIIYGIMSHSLDFAFIVVDADTIDNPEVKIYMSMCKGANIPIALVITKNDLSEINKDRLIDYTNIPIFNISSKNGTGINEIHNFLGNTVFLNKEFIDQTPYEGTLFNINEVYYIPDVGTVVAGNMLIGEIQIGDKLLIGPFKNSFKNVTIISIHRKQTPCRSLTKGQFGSFLINYDQELSINKHLSIISNNNMHLFVNKFCIQVCLKGRDIVKFNQVLPINSNNVQDTVSVIDYDINYSGNNSLIYVAFRENCINLIMYDKPIIIRFPDMILCGTCVFDLDYLSN